MSKAQSNQRFKWMLVLAAVLLLPLLLSLGFWQLDRADQKQRLITSWERAESLSLIPSLSDFSKHSYIQLELEGYLNVQQYFLLDNRTRSGRVGYEVVALLTTDQDITLPVNMGWISLGSSRDQLPTLTLPAEKVKVTGSARLIVDSFVLGAVSHSSEWPRVIQKLDPEYLQDQLQTVIYPVEVRVKQSIIPQLTLEWLVGDMLPQKHTAYAVQWFAMAFALSVLLLWSWFQLRKEVSYE